MPHYRIRPGASFRAPDDSIKTGGQFIELPEELAEHHADKVEPDPHTAEQAAEIEAAAAAKPAGEPDPE